MNKPITLNLPENVYNRAEELAQLIGRDLTDVLIEAISLSLSSTSPIIVPSFKSMSDHRIPCSFSSSQSMTIDYQN